MTNPRPQAFVAPLSETNGTFWTTDGQPVTGMLVAKNKRTRLTLNGFLSDDPRVIHPTAGSSVTRISRTAERSVAASLPRDIFGTLDTGAQVSLIRAQNFGGSGLDLLPEFQSSILISGDHVTASQLYRAVRFRLDQPYWTQHLIDGESAITPDDGSVISVKFRDGVPWLVYECAIPATLLELSRRVVSGCVVLGWLMWDERIVSAETEVRIDAVSPWLSVQGRQFTRTPKSDPSGQFLPRESLTVALLADWIALNTQLDGLTWAVHELVNGTVQARTILGTSLIEGYHRRMDGIYAQKKCVMITPKNGGAPVKKVVNKSFNDRATEVISEVSDIASELISTVPNLPKILTDARNDIAHHLVDKTRSHEDRFVGWIVAARICPWLLRVFLLVHAGIDRQVLLNGLAISSNYEYACANASQRAIEAGLR